MAEERLGGLAGALADHQRQRKELVRRQRLEHGAVGGDQRDAPLVLPERERLAFLDLDAQSARVKLEHGGVRDPRIGQQPRARVAGIEEQQRAVAGDAGEREDFLAADAAFAAERDLADAEAGGARRLIAKILHLGGDLGGVAAAHDAVADAGEQQERRGRRAEPARHLPVENACGRVPGTRRRIGARSGAPFRHQPSRQTYSAVHRSSRLDRSRQTSPAQPPGGLPLTHMPSLARDRARHAAKDPSLPAFR